MTLADSDSLKTPQPDRHGARQLTLDLGSATSYADDEFLVSPSNARAHATVEAWPAWPDTTLILCGPAGCGKSHIGAIWAARANAETIRSGDRLRPGPPGAPVVALIEDCDRAGHREADLFHLINIAQETQGSLLLTARVPPAQWRLDTADLLSRLRRAPLIAIERPDTDLIRAVIVKLFADRQVRVDEETVMYAARHCEQSLEAVNEFVSAVDQEGLTTGRRITRALASHIFARMVRRDSEQQADPRYGPT